jgi:hypothetical protein
MVSAPPSKGPTPMKRSLRCSPSRTCLIPSTIASRPNTKAPTPHDLKIIPYDWASYEQDRRRQSQHVRTRRVPHGHPLFPLASVVAGIVSYRSRGLRGRFPVGEECEESVVKVGLV